MRPAMSSGDRPLYCSTAPTTGMPIVGKMSVGVRSAAIGPKIRMTIASTRKV